MLNVLKLPALAENLSYSKLGRFYKVIKEIHIK